MTQKLEEAKRLYKTANADQRYVLEKLFPELKESEDERIRKDFCKDIWNYIPYEKAHKYIAWLEKQGEQKPSTIDIDKMVDDYANNKERGNEEFGKPVPCMIRAYRQGLNDAIGKVVLKPAWSEDDETGLTNTIIMLKEGASLHFIKKDITKAVDWLKSIKERVLPQPKQEWSEEDERNLKGIIDEIEANKNQAPDYDLATYGRFLSWLKSPKERYTWKPSDEQMEALWEAYRGGEEQAALASLYSDLKKLKGEQL